jgi:hypothetical protein
MKKKRIKVRQHRRKTKGGNIIVRKHYRRLKRPQSTTLKTLNKSYPSILIGLSKYDSPEGYDKIWEEHIKKETDVIDFIDQIRYEEVLPDAGTIYVKEGDSLIKEWKEKGLAYLHDKQSKLYILYKIDKGEAEEIIEKKAKDYFKPAYELALSYLRETLEKLRRSPFLIREIIIPVEEQLQLIESIRKGKQERGVGIFWSPNPEKAEAHKKSGEITEHLVFVVQLLSFNDIDLEETISTNTTYGTREEEIRLIPGKKTLLKYLFSSMEGDILKRVPDIKEQLLYV